MGGGGGGLGAGGMGMYLTCFVSFTRKKSIFLENKKTKNKQTKNKTKNLRSLLVMFVSYSPFKSGFIIVHIPVLTRVHF